jgi:tetratricopeptide (TPR) repeat protein
MQQGNVDGAVKDLESVLGKDPTNQAVAQAAVNQLVELNRSDEALKLLSKTIEAQPSDGLYRLRAILYRMQGEEDKALEDLNKALAMEPEDPVSLLQRAEISIFQGDVKSAKQDLRAAIDVAPQIANAKEAIYVRCLIASEEGRTADAINDMKQLVQREPENVVRRLQLANLYREDGRPRRAIDTLSAILQRDPGNPIALRYRADTLLGVGEHEQAVEDYEKALKQVADDDGEEAAGILNNLAWVLATSPEDELRDGSRAVELAERAAKLTDYEQAHILSTLAAAHAEAGDFQEAVRWSEKSVEIARREDHEQLEQLEQELESFRNGEPWRERQQTEENEAPLLDPEDLIDT